MLLGEVLPVEADRIATFVCIFETLYMRKVVHLRHLDTLVKVRSDVTADETDTSSHKHAVHTVKRCITPCKIRINSTERIKSPNGKNDRSLPPVRMR